MFLEIKIRIRRTWEIREAIRGVPRKKRPRGSKYCVWLVKREDITTEVEWFIVKTFYYLDNFPVPDVNKITLPPVGTYNNIMDSEIEIEFVGCLGLWIRFQIT